MQRSDRLWLLGVGLLAALVVLGSAAWKVADAVRDLDDCDAPTDWNGGLGPASGSCAPPFAVDDVAAGRASLEALGRLGPQGHVSISYEFTNHSTEWRSLDSSKVTVVDPSGRAVHCSWDNSAGLLPSAPGATEAHPCIGVRSGLQGMYTLLYLDETVDTVDVP